MINISIKNIIPFLSPTCTLQVGELSKKIYEVFAKYQEKEVDVFGIYKYLQKYNTNFYNKIKKEYYDYYKKIQLETNITIDLLTSGLSEERI